MTESEKYDGDQGVVSRSAPTTVDIWSSVRKLLFLIGSMTVLLLALRNSITYHLQHFWGASGDFWQHQWDKTYAVFGNDDYNIIVYGTTLVSYTLYWSAGGLYTLVDLTNKPAFLRPYKIQPGTNEPVEKRLVLKCFLMVSFNQLVAQFLFSMMCAFPLTLIRGYDTSPMLPTFHWVLFELTIFVLLEEIGFYYSHRLFHHRLLYKHYHKIHHEWQSPIAITALYAHPLEHVCSNVAPVFLGPLVMGSHPATSLLWVGITTLSTIQAHCGYHLPFFPSNEFHDYHHLKFNQCYGVLGLLDHLHGTDDKFRVSKSFVRNTTNFNLVPPRLLFPDDNPASKKDIKQL